MPSRYFTKTWSIPQQQISSTGTDLLKLQLVFTDTIILTASREPDIARDFAWSSRLPTEQKQQIDWLQTTLEDSDADFLLVFGHFPVFSGGTGEFSYSSLTDLGYSHCDLKYCSGMHGSPTNMQFLRKMLEQHQAHYFSGHDHIMQVSMEFFRHRLQLLVCLN